MIKKVISHVLYSTAEYAAQSYVAGRKVSDALRVCRELQGQGLKFTICAWDQAGDSKESVSRAYDEALEILFKTPIDIYLSVKVPSLQYDSVLIRSLVERAASRNIRVHFDAHDLESADPTLDLAAEIAAKFKNVGITIPARWTRSIDDARRFAKMPVAIRIVKGQWADPTFDDAQINENYIELVECLSGRSDIVAVASHDVALAKRALTLLTETTTPCELEQLYGLPLRMSPYLKALQIPLRVYVPYGAGYLPYAVSMVRKRPVIMWWLIRDAARRVSGTLSELSAHK